VGQFIDYLQPVCGWHKLNPFRFHAEYLTKKPVTIPLKVGYFGAQGGEFLAWWC
jgi:hypothetical protein